MEHRKKLQIYRASFSWTRNVAHDGVAKDVRQHLCYCLRKLHERSQEVSIGKSRACGGPLLTGSRGVMSITSRSASIGDICANQTQSCSFSCSALFMRHLLCYFFTFHRKFLYIFVRSHSELEGKCLTLLLVFEEKRPLLVVHFVGSPFVVVQEGFLQHRSSI